MKLRLGEVIRRFVGLLTPSADNRDELIALIQAYPETIFKGGDDPNHRNPPASLHT